MPKVHPYTVVILFFSMALLISCNKEDTNGTLPNTPPVKKLKRTYTSYTGKTKAVISELSYDINGRLVQYNLLEQDSATLPAKIISFQNVTLFYEGVNEYPHKSIIELPNGRIDSMIYFYDNQARVIREQLYHLGNITNRNEYTYINPGQVTVTVYLEQGGPGPSLYEVDSVFFDAQDRITEGREHVIVGYGFSTSYSYDTKINPYSNIGAYKHIFSLYVRDHSYTYRSPNNWTHFHANGSNSYTMDNTKIHVYDTDSYPVSCTGHIETTNPSQAENYTTKFEYY